MRPLILSLLFPAIAMAQSAPSLDLVALDGRKVKLFTCDVSSVSEEEALVYAGIVNGTPNYVSRRVTRVRTYNGDWFDVANRVDVVWGIVKSTQCPPR